MVVVVLRWFSAVSECGCGRVKLVPGTQAEGSDHMSKMSSGGDVFNPVIKKSPLTVSKKIYEFYTAPITKFWMHTVSQLSLTLLTLTLTLAHPLTIAHPSTLTQAHHTVAESWSAFCRHLSSALTLTADR